MELKPGYKQTEVGVIPEDWDAVRIGNIATVEGGYAFNSKKFLSSGKYQVIKMGNLYGGALDIERRPSFLNELNDQEKYYLLHRNDILITLTGTVGKRDYGYSYRVENENNLILNQRVARLIVNESNNPIYINGQIKSPNFLNQFFDVSKGGTGNQANVGTEDVAAIYIPLPTKAEQEAIAEALSDTDALIESLEQLIAKKHHLKQGAMQELLTGKKRLLGFNGEWEERTFGSIVERIVGGGTPSRIVATYWNGDVPWMTVKDFAQHSQFGTIEYITNEGLKKSASHLIPKHTLITSTRMALGKAVIYEVDVAINQDLKAIFPTKDIDTLFLYYWFQFNEARIGEMGSGSTVMGLSLEDLRKITLSKPPFDEQAAIANILSDIDAEIAALEAKLAKARQVKQGMMQELLTGRIRLV